MSSPRAPADLVCDPNLLICNACGTQYDVAEGQHKDECKICDDPRQYVPEEGQIFTTLSKLKREHRNIWWQDKHDSRIWSVRTEPKFAIGNRAELIQTPYGNVLWDLIPLLDQVTVDKINSLGGLEAIVISHPHYYSTWTEWLVRPGDQCRFDLWSRTFKCPVYAGAPDLEWLERTDTPGTEMRPLTETYTSILVAGHDCGINAILAGGHFPGSLLLHWENNLFIADTIFAVPSATNPVPGKKGVISFTFFWSIPNRIPLHPDDIMQIWLKVKEFQFDTAFGAFEGMDIYTMKNEEERGTGGVKGRLLESCKIYTRAMGWKEHDVLKLAL